MKPIKEMFPESFVQELLRLARQDRDWVQWQKLEGEAYTAKTVLKTPLSKLWTSGADAFSMWALSIWLADGPKVFKPSLQQCEDMEQIEVNLQLSEYAQPYPALMVWFPPDRYAPFESIICHHTERLLTCALMSADHLHDITTTVAVDGRPIETSLNKYDESCREDGMVAGRALRVAINSCLCLVNFGCRKQPLLQKEYERDRHLAHEQTERGQRARERLKSAMSLVSFSQDVTLRETEAKKREPGEPTGREVSPHWRRGHWAMAVCGKGRTERRRTLRKPCFVRADKFFGDQSDTSVTYHE